MNTTIDLSDSSIDCSVVIEDTASLKDPDKKRATKNGRKKVSGIKLDDTVDLISSSDDESKDEQNIFQTSKNLSFKLTRFCCTSWWYPSSYLTYFGSAFNCYLLIIM